MVTSSTGVLSWHRVYGNTFLFHNRKYIHQLTITDNHWMEYYGWVEIPQCTCCQNTTRGRKQDLFLCQCGRGETISTSLMNAWLQYMRCRINFCGRHDLAASLFFLGTAYHWNVSQRTRTSGSYHCGFALMCYISSYQVPEQGRGS